MNPNHDSKGEFSSGGGGGGGGAKLSSALRSARIGKPVPSGHMTSSLSHAQQAELKALGPKPSNPVARANWQEDVDNVMAGR